MARFAHEIRLPRCLLSSPARFRNLASPRQLHNRRSSGGYQRFRVPPFPAMESHHASRGRRTVRLHPSVRFFSSFGDEERFRSASPFARPLLMSQATISFAFVAAGRDPAEEGRREDAAAAAQPARRRRGSVQRRPIRLVYPSLPLYSRAIRCNLCLICFASVLTLSRNNGDQL